jgi:hypothetical protein
VRNWRIQKRTSKASSLSTRFSARILSQRKGERDRLGRTRRRPAEYVFSVMVGMARCPYYENCQACFFWFLFYGFNGGSVRADGWDTRKEMSAKEVGVGRVSGGLPWRG